MVDVEGEYQVAPVAGAVTVTVGAVISLIVKVAALVPSVLRLPAQSRA